MSLAEVSVWVMLGLISGSVPWSIILTNWTGGKDARSVGDGPHERQQSKRSYE